MPRVLEFMEPPDGGVAQAVLQIARGVGDHGFEAEVACPPEAVIRAPLEAAGIPVRPLAVSRSYGNPRREARALAALVALLRGGRFDLLHCHSAKAGVLGRIAARTVGLPVIYSPHCLPFVGEVSAARKRFALATERLMGPLTTAMLCVCEDERRLALEHRLLPAARTRVVHNGTGPCEHDGEPDPRLTALRGDDGIVAGAVTVLRPQKGLGDLLEAVPQVLSALPLARIAIVGNGPIEAELRSQVEALGLHREPRFAMLPFEGPPARHIRGLDLYVLPSVWEAFPIGPLEAMACGVPQVATDVGGTREAVGAQTGLLVPARRPAALAEAIIELLGDAPRRRELADASLRLHAQRFTERTMVAGTAAVYRDVLSGAGSTGGARPATA